MNVKSADGSMFMILTHFSRVMTSYRVIFNVPRRESGHWTIRLIIMTNTGINGDPIRFDNGKHITLLCRKSEFRLWGKIQVMHVCINNNTPSVVRGRSFCVRPSSKRFSSKYFNNKSTARRKRERFTQERFSYNRCTCLCGSNCARVI